MSFFNLSKLRSAYNTSVRKPKGKGPPGRPTSRWEGGTEKDVRQIGTVMGCCEHGNGPWIP
jgi:hypothetical protein